MDNNIDSIYIAPPDWKLDDINPFTKKIFCKNWIGLFLDKANDSQMWNGTTKSGLFAVKYNRNVDNLKQMITDFIFYQKNRDSKVIVGSNYINDIKSYLNMAIASAATDYGVRESDSKYIVHSTSRESWKNIQKDMKLKSPKCVENRRFQYRQYYRKATS